MVRRRQIFEGKTKIFFEVSKPGCLAAHFKDDAVYDHKLEQIDENPHMIIGKGVINNRISEYIMTKLDQIGVPNHFVKNLNMREQLVKQVEIIPVGVVVRNVVAGSLARRFNLSEGDQLPRSIIELYYKSETFPKPMILEEHVTAFGWATPHEIEEMMALSLRINDFLLGLFIGVGVRLVDLKLEFGRSYDSEHVRVILADEVSPDSCRLWDTKTQSKFGFDRYFSGMDNIAESYQQIASRLGILPENVGDNILESRLMSKIN
jgi:phosphoribosylaminoimidazole-succinocarboxamide synthase